MSLQVWLPLNGDLHNQGLSGLTATNSGATVNNSGKIGKCYQFGTASSYMTLPKEAMTSFTTEASVCFWLDILTWNTSYATYFQAGLGSSPWNNYIFGLLRNSSNSNCCFTITGSSSSQANYTTPNLDLNKWYHIALIYKTGHCLIYINGQLHQDYTTAIVPNFAGITKITLGVSNATGSYQTNCLMNDVRIYDHALSPKEVEEIAKGLVLHYKLDLPQPNLLKLGNVERNNNSQTNNILYYYYDFTGNLPTGTYTFSFDAKSSNGTDSCYLSYANGSSTINRIATLTNIPTIYTHYSFTFTNSSTTSNDIFFTNYKGHGSPTNSSNTGYLYIKNVKLENGSVETPFELATSEGNLISVIYDSSGYANNGTIVDSLTAAAGSPRYETYTNLTTTSSHIYTPALTTAGFTNSFSISWWGNVSTYAGKMMWGFSNGNRLNGIYNGTLWNTGDGSNNPLYTPGTTTQVTAPTVNVWHHFVMVGDGSTCKVYKDGELWAQAKTYKSLTGTIIYFNGWANSTDYALANTKISDFRIYATAFTADQIKELYNTSATIDNAGNIYAREIKEA